MLLQTYSAEGVIIEHLHLDKSRSSCLSMTVTVVDPPNAVALARSLQHPDDRTARLHCSILLHAKQPARSSRRAALGNLKVVFNKLDF